ncbi:dihydrofolate reductase family protein [Microbacterium koreense]|uniref:Dihydrofolate reductase family protein n=1 Tax=Microbacterium koreense TaxID=323761 RepID=A0ABW2ZPI1_9MICO
MEDMTPRTADGKVLWHFTMSLDGFVAGPGHSMDWMRGIDDTGERDIIAEYVETTGAILGGRDGWDAFPDAEGVYGGRWSGPAFVLTHHPEDAAPSPGVTFLDCDVAEAVQIALDAAGGKNVEVLSASIGTQLLERGLLDEIDIHLAPVLLGDGIRLYDVPGSRPVPLTLVNGEAGRVEVPLRYRPSAW